MVREESKRHHRIFSGENVFALLAGQPNIAYISYPDWMDGLYPDALSRGSGGNLADPTETWLLHRRSRRLWALRIPATSCIFQVYRLYTYRYRKYRIQ